MRKLKNALYYTKAYVGIGFTALAFLTIAGYLLLKGAGSLDLAFLFGIGAPEGESLVPAIAATLLMIVLTLLLAIPVGVGSAIYLNEYAKPGSRIVSLIRLATESLAGIPSIVFGLFGFLFFVLFMGWSWSVLAGVCTLSIMVLPTVMRSTEEALKAVPQGYREASFALGAGKLRTILKVVLPSAVSSILVSVVLSIGRIVGESAALVLTAGTVAKIPRGSGFLFQSAASLSVFMYTLTTEGADFGKAYATAIVLLVIVFIINRLSNRLAQKFGRK